ncbi:hypothetical protein [Luethyella okanaganae]|uniref:Acetone carboxylase n=1 Tax=Luethyella okanaganae TaxID=69372 RepID=A0ABW1VDL2_9MICO
MIELGGELPRESCSRAECRSEAIWRIDWRNPRIHSAERRKTWLACDEHIGFLRDFLSAREFPLDVTPLDSTASAPSRGDGP